MTSIWQRLYDHEVNVEIIATWDAGWRVRIGDAMSGYKAQTTVPTWAEAEGWAEEAARRHYPHALGESGSMRQTDK
jgi:hypothetical protein